MTLYLDKAIGLDKKLILGLLEKGVDECIEKNLFAEGACLGYVLLHHQPKDYRLANKIGNCERKMERYKEANSLYRHALKVSQNFDWPLHNMAASMAKEDLYDGDIRKVIKMYIHFQSFLMPDINYFEEPEVMDSLFLKFKHEEYCTKVNELQCFLFSKELQDAEVMEKKFTISAKMMKNKYLREAENLEYREKANQVLAKIADQNWDIYTPQEKNTISWEIYRVVTQTFSQHKILLKDSTRNDDFIRSDHFQYIKNLLFKLQEVGSDLNYLDMLIAVIFFLEGDASGAIDILKKLLEKNRENRFFNINLGLIYFYKGNRLMAFKHLVKGAVVLQHLEGYYLLSDIILLAQRKQIEKDYDKALELYKIVANETNDIKYLKSLGAILVELGNYDDAIQVFLEIKAISPENETAKKQLQKLVLVLKNLGNEAWQSNHFQNALDYFLKILKIRRDIPEILRKTSLIYKRMGRHKEVFALDKEREELLARLRETEKEKERLGLIDKGKDFIKMRKFNDGIQCLNDALLLKPDKQLYTYMVSLYKKLKFSTALMKLEARWNRMYKEEPDI